MMGRFAQEGFYNHRKYYKQQDIKGNVSHYLYYYDGGWFVSKSLRGGDYLRNLQDTETPPVEGWEYYGGGGILWGNWYHDDLCLFIHL